MRTIQLSVILGLAVSAGTACTGGDNIGYSGYPMNEFFKFDGTCRGWEFVSDDTSLPYMMVGALQPEFTMADDGFTSIHTIDYRTRCITQDGTCTDDELLRSITLSSTRAEGTLIYSFDDGGGATSFDPPVKLTDGDWAPTEIATTETAGTTVTSEFFEIGACDIRWANWEDGCVHIVVDDAGGGTGLAGEYWAASGWDFVAWDIEGDTGRWSLDRGIFLTDVDLCNDEGLPILGE